MSKILIIDDDHGMCAMMSRELGYRGHEASTANTLTDGLEQASLGAFDLVFLDVRMPDGDGVEKLADIKSVGSNPEVVIITGFADPDSAELAIKSGAWDYLKKPFSMQEMNLILERALQFRREKMQRKPMRLERSRIVGSSPQIMDCIDLLAQAAASDVSTLITGETGTGKELFALAIHENSQRAGKNFVVLDCTVLPDTLVESMLFGHKKGTFTGAVSDKEGLIEQADGGTLFMDEIGELPMSMQKAFLRVLQEHRFRPVGGRDEIKSNFKLIAATNRNLKEMVENGKFRQDLLYRISAFTIVLPPLRNRREDIEPLTRFHIKELCNRYGIAPKTISPDFIETLMKYDFPGNVRELVNTIDRVLTVARHETTLFANHLPTEIRAHLARAALEANGPVPASTDEKIDTTVPLKDIREQTVAKVEKAYLHQIMQSTGGDIRKMCNIAGISRSQLYTLLKRYNISRSNITD